MERTRSGWERWPAIAGVAYIILHFLYFAVASVADPGSSARSLARDYTHNATQVTLGGTLQQALALVLLLFAISLRAHLRRGEREPRTLSSLILIAAVASAVLTFLGSACTLVLAHNVARLGDANLTFGLTQVWWATFLAADVMLGIMVLAASALALTTNLFSRWLGWLGILCGLALVGGCLAFYPTGAVMQGPADGIAYIGENLFVLWALGTSITILRGRRFARVERVPERATEHAMA
jgi:hypothetical protein